MPDYRLIHRRALRGEKVGKLTDFERGVWLAYLLIADDYGVMPFDAGELAKAIWLKGKTQKTVQRALERVRDVGLIQTWTHQGATYCYAADWQEWQNVRHPRGTIEPCPPVDIVARCKAKTRLLFAEHSRIADGIADEDLPQDSGKVSEILPQVPRLACAGGRETLTLTANASTNADEGGVGETREARAGAFCEWYSETHHRLFGVGYMGTQKDYQKAIELADRFSDAEMRDGALVWFGMDDDFATNGTRTIPKFASRITGCLQQARQRGIA